MNRSHLAMVALLGGAVLWVGASAQQEVQPRPGFGTGVMSVNVLNRPAVLAEQIGEWQVSIGKMPEVRIANTPTVAVQSPVFATRGAKYLVTWTTGQTERIAVSAAGEAGWVQVEHSGRGKRWINLSNARAIEEVVE
jgi:hypothetical protein